MITENIFDAIFGLVDFILGLLPTIPGGNLGTTLDRVLEFIFSNLDLFTIFVRPATLMLVIPLFLGIHYFDKIYTLVSWGIRMLKLNI